MTTKTSAPGKVILLGEHAAVYGNPVLVASVDLRTYATVSKRNDERFTLSNRSTGINDLEFTLKDLPRMKREWATVLTAECIEKTFARAGTKAGLDIEIYSDIPVSSGLGSSASASSALALAILTELGEGLELKEVANLAWSIENVVHGKSSGVDPFAVTFGGIIRYREGKFDRVEVKILPEITVGNTGVRSDTGDVVRDVMNLKNKFPDFFEHYLEIMVHIVDYGQKFLEDGDLEGLGAVMNINHGLLSAIGVSNPELERLVWAARKASPGAKLCGAGRGGIMVALGDAEKEIKEAGGTVIKTMITKDGVRIDD